MTKKYLAVVLFTALLTGVVETSSALELSQYNKLDTVGRILNDSEVTDNLRTLLGNHYQTFIDNFDVFGEPHTTTGGGLFVEGWLKDLYLENASALVINPDGKIFAAWVVPESDVIHYQSSDNSPGINVDIQQWAARFNTMQFATNSQSRPAFDGVWAGGAGGRAVLEIKGSEMEWRLVTPPQKGNDYTPLRYTLRKAASVHHAETRKLDTEKFTISLINKCGRFEGECDQMVYLGVRKSDNSTISLKGKTLHDSAGKIIGSTYKNGEVVYTVTYEPAKLVVSKGSQVLVEQSGQWRK
ncbi:hypothetical protein MCV29_18210 [Enterobacter asburiae]|uniref:hypothetical protein n=1 Tax=Enterobacter asburiae TaxID=61645 RepID=UPI001EF985D8|nr:hypothetical protein [Enterobacter asburiae]MCG7803141.1 hypothetical protein [Enterobacter asburiae]